MKQGKGYQSFTKRMHWSQQTLSSKNIRETLHMDITRWSTPKSDWLYSLQPKMEKLYTVNKNKTRNWLWLRSWSPYCQIRLKMKKVEKTTRPCRYNLNHIPYDYTVEVRNRFKGLDFIECLKNYGQKFMTLYRRQWCTRKRNVKMQWCTRKRNAKRQNILGELTNS